MCACENMEYSYHALISYLLECPVYYHAKQKSKTILYFSVHFSPLYRIRIKLYPAYCKWAISVPARHIRMRNSVFDHVA